jgi:hypothetical protein
MAADDKSVEKMGKLLDLISEVKKFGATDEELTADDLDKVTAGVAIPNFYQYLQTVRERNAKD